MIGCTHAPRKTARRVLSVLLLSLLGLLACESEVTTPDETFEEGLITLDATAAETFAYLTLAGDGSLVTPTDPAASTDWDMAFRRFTVRLNGGVSGPGSVGAVNLGNNANATAEEVTALTPDDGRAAFDAVTDADIPGAGSFLQDRLEPEPGATWFRFDGRANTIVANHGAAWKLREGSGRGHALLRVVAIEMDGQRPVGLTIEYRRQDPGASLGAPETLAFDLRRGPAFGGLVNGIVGNPAGCDWDLTFAPDFSVAVNADCGAGSFPLESTDDFMALQSADDAPEYAGFLSVIGGPFPATVSDASGTYWYDIQGNRRMWPTYNVFLVQTADAVYKVQITDYYNATGESGYPAVRFLRLR